MSDVERTAQSEGEAPVNPYSLLEAVNASSETANTGWMVFIAVLTYLLVAVAGVTHKDLLLSKDIPLPILQVGIEMTRFFLFAPIVLLLFHVGVVTQLVMLARKTLELDHALQVLEISERRTHPLRLELNNFFFVQAIAGPERSRVVNGLLHGLSWLTLVVLPVVLLLYIQVAFLPYHDVAITWAHRVVLLADVALLAFIGVFLSRPETSLGVALVNAGLAHPLTFLLTVVLLGAISLFSLLVATVPGERLDVLAHELKGERVRRTAGGAASSAQDFLLSFGVSSADGRLFGLFARNLIVTDLDLVNDKDTTPGERTLNLRGRDLRYARFDRTDLHQADLTGANLDGASFVDADLRGARLNCADISLLVLSDNRAAATCASARRANLTGARLGGANLAGLDLTAASLLDADLVGARLSHAVLAGAGLSNARLEKADVGGGVSLEGANLAAAALQGADLTGARLLGADLTHAGLQGASLDFASLEGASLRNADLEGATLYRARLGGADLDGANITAASLREAWTWQTAPPQPARAALAELGGLRTSTPTKEEIAALEVQTGRIGDKAVEGRLREALAGVLAAAGGGRSGAPGEEAAARGWAELQRLGERERTERVAAVVTEPRSASDSSAWAAGSGPPASVSPIADPGAPGDPRGRLTRHLADLACLPRWNNGSVATGIARRALNPGFNGDARVLYERLRMPACSASLSVPPALLNSLAGRADSQRTR